MNPNTNQASLIQVNEVEKRSDFDKSRIRLFEQLRDAGSELSREANSWVEEGDYTSGINRMQAATNKVVKGLQLLGIPLSMQ